MPDPIAPRGDLSVTALYTCETWHQAGLPAAHLYASDVSRRVYGTVNGVLRIASWFVRGAPSLPIGLMHRHALIDALVREAAPGVVLELAAGLSPRGAAFTAEGDLRYVEVDLPAVVAYKHALLERTVAGRAVLARPGLQRVGADVTTTELSDVLVPDGPAVVVVEGLLVYLSPEAQHALLARLAAWLRPHGGRVVFDLVPGPELPQAGPIGRLLGALMRRFTGGKGFAPDERDRDALRAAFRSAGFDDVVDLAAAEVAHARGLPHPDAPTNQVVWLATVEPSP